MNSLSPSSFSQMVGSFLPHGLSQMTFFEMDVNRASRKQFGTIGEQTAAAMFQQAGYEVSGIAHGDQRGDLLVVDTDTGECWRVEVKSMRRGSEGRYQACLKRQIKARVCTDAAHSEFVLLLAFPRIGAPIPFLIPSAATQNRKQITISKDPLTYQGVWSQFRQMNGLKMPQIERED